MTSSYRLGIAALLTFVACGGGSPTAPVTKGMIVYKDKNFRSDSYNVTGDVSDLKDIRPSGDWCDASSDGRGHLGDCISSIRILEGWRAIVYIDDAYRGASLEVTGDMPDLERVPGPCDGNWGDCISSIRLIEDR